MSCFEMLHAVSLPSRGRFTFLTLASRCARFGRLDCEVKGFQCQIVEEKMELPVRVSGMTALSRIEWMMISSLEHPLMKQRHSASKL